MAKTVAVKYLQPVPGKSPAGKGEVRHLPVEEAEKLKKAKQVKIIGLPKDETTPAVKTAPAPEAKADKA